MVQRYPGNIASRDIEVSQVSHLSLVPRSFECTIDSVGPHFAVISRTGPSLVLSKSNGQLQATWNSKAASY